MYLLLYFIFIFFILMPFRFQYSLFSRLELDLPDKNFVLPNKQLIFFAKVVLPKNEKNA